MGQAREPVFVEALFAEAPVEGLDVGVLGRLPRRGQAQGEAALVGPGCEASVISLTKFSCEWH